MGTRKLYHQIRESLTLNSIKLGRDKLFDLLREQQMLILPKKRYTQTTMSKHWLRKYPNIIRDILVDRPEQVWVSDITYIKTDEGNCYLNMVTDAFSRKIMGYAIADNMDARNMKEAFEMAIMNRKYKGSLIHHSDRGLQYCSKEYISIAEKNNIKISMTEKGDPYENALAERMNRTVKEEFGLGRELNSRENAKLLVKQAVYIYNKYRPHLSLKMKTPEMVH
jgi:putative transposase